MGLIDRRFWEQRQLIRRRSNANSAATRARLADALVAQSRTRQRHFLIFSNGVGVTTTISRATR